MIVTISCSKCEKTKKVRANKFMTPLEAVALKRKIDKALAPHSDHKEQVTVICKTADGKENDFKEWKGLKGTFHVNFRV